MRYWPTDANADTACDSSALPKDLITSLGSGNIDMTATSASFTERGSCDIAIPAEGPQTSLSVLTSFDLSLLSDGEVRYRLRAVDASCAVLASSPYSTTLTGAGVNVQTLTLNWPANAVRLRLSIEVRRITTSASARLRCGTNSYLDVPWWSRLRQIVAAIVARLQTISLASGYNTTPAAVVAGAPDHTKLGGYPVILIGAGFGERKVMTFGSGEAKHQMDQTAVLALKVITAGTDDPYSDALLVTEDIVAALEASSFNLALPFNCKAWAEASPDDEIDPEISKPYGFRLVRVNVNYRGMRGRI